MKRNDLKELSLCIFLVCSFFTSCINEETEETVLPKEISIQVSIDAKDTQTRASDVLDREKVTRYDIFIFDETSGALDKHLSGSYATGVEQFNKIFTSNIDLYTGTKEVYVIANNISWESSTQEQMDAITRDEVLNLVLPYNQNIIETDDGKLTGFTGYIKNDGSYEPFVMTVKKTNVNFRTTPTLQVKLKRTYAKVILQFATELTGASEKDWQALKSIKIEAIENIPQSAAVITGGVAATPTILNSYVFDHDSPFEVNPNNANLITGYSYDTFEEALSLKIPPYIPSVVDGKIQAATIKLTFCVGPTAGNVITKEFTRTISIGNSLKGYQIEANYAYVIKISSSKTNSGISVNTTVLPWNSESFENEVLPEY